MFVLTLSLATAYPQTVTNQPATVTISNQTSVVHSVVANSQADANRHAFWPDTFKDWADIIQVAVVIVAGIVGIFGINAWRREFVGQRRIELAEEVLALFYQARDLVEFIRFPAGYANETAGREAGSEETAEQKRVRDDAFATQERYKKNNEVFSKIFTLRYRFMARFGKDSAIPFAELKSIIDELVVALRQWVMLSLVDERTFTSSESLKEHRRRIEKYERTIWGLDDDDPVKMRLDNVITRIERICEPIVTGR